MLIVFQARRKQRERGTYEEKNQIPVGYQGVPGAYSFEAACSYFGDKASLQCYASFDDLCQAVVSREVVYGLLPIINSQTGHILEMNDLFVRYSLRIVGTIDQPIYHCLLCLPGQEIKDIVIVISHPQAINQCKGYLDQLKTQITTTDNTAASAKLIRTQSLKGFAAIASAQAAKYYQLQILASGIQDHPNNITRFAVITAAHESLALVTQRMRKTT